MLCTATALLHNRRACMLFVRTGQVQACHGCSAVCQRAMHQHTDPGTTACLVHNLLQKKAKEIKEEIKKEQSLPHPQCSSARWAWRRAAPRNRSPAPCSTRAGVPGCVLGRVKQLYHSITLSRSRAEQAAHLGTELVRRLVSNPAGMAQVAQPRSKQQSSPEG